MSKFQDDIIKFNTMYGLPAPALPTEKGITVPVAEQLARFKKMLLNELDELDPLLEAYGNIPEYLWFAELADWLGDIQVYAASEMRKFGLPNDEVLDIIMQSNASKLGADGKPIVVDGKVQKGPNYWKPEPRLAQMISHHMNVNVVSPAPGPMPAPAPVVEPSTAPRSYAHTAQVGGSHYAQGDKPQHWDLSIMYQWDPFQYQITKYVMRWKDKHPTAEKKLEDLKKARSFLDKYIDNYREFLPAKEETSAEHAQNHARLATMGEEDAKKFFTCEGYHGDGSNLYKCKACKHLLNASSFLDALQYHDCEIDAQAGKSYVAQG